MAATRGNRKRPTTRRTEPRTEADAAEEEPLSATGEVRANALPELVRRVLTGGLSGLFNTNEMVRRAVGDAMPREWVDFAVNQSERTRAEFIERLAGELARTLESLELVELADRFLDGRTIEIRAQVQLLPREGKVRTRALDVAMTKGGKSK